MNTEYRSAAILAGGKSSRFGSNKAIVQLSNGRLMIETVINSVKKTADKIFIVANKSEPYSELGIEIIPDEFPDKGPLAGIHVALKHTRGLRVFVVACDMPFVSPELIDKMWHIKTWAPVVIPEHDKGLEPLHAIYHKSLIPVVENHLAREMLGLKKLLDVIPCRTFKEQEMMSNAKRLNHFFANINTQEELKKLTK